MCLDMAFKLIHSNLVVLAAGPERNATWRSQTSSFLQDGVQHGHPVAPQHQVLSRGPVLQHGPAAGGHPEGHPGLQQPQQEGEILLGSSHMIINLLSLRVLYTPVFIRVLYSPRV